MSRELEEINRSRNEELFSGIEKQYQEIAKIKAESEQIEEMARDICRSRFAEGAILCKECNKECLYYQIATALTAKGYRKQSEGEWIKDEESRFVHRYHCSVCNFYLIGEPTKYCEDCGAKMKGGAE